MTPYYETDNGKLYNGECLETLKLLPDESVDCVMTSPPYWALRDYGAAGVIWDGDSSCNHEWVSSRVEHDNMRFRGGEHTEVGNNSNAEIYHGRENSGGQHCDRCGAWLGLFGLEPSFQLYINHLIQIFDEIKRVLKAAGTCWVNVGDTYWGSGRGEDGKYSIGRNSNYQPCGKNNPAKGKEYINKSLCQIPERFAIGMTDHGWIKRNTIIWYKPNCMPSSADDRFTVDFEYLYFFTKNKQYYFEQQQERAVSGKSDIKKMVEGKDRIGGIHKTLDDKYNKASKRTNIGRKRSVGNPSGRNKRCVWKIPTQSLSEAHFAVFPKALCRIPIKAGSPESGVVLDPFMGSGTVALVSEDIGRKWIGIEINQEYCEIAKKRIERETSQLKLFV